MPKNPVTDPITDQEMAFAHLVLSGTMNDRRASEAVGLNPDTAAYTKAKPRVRDYMLEHRAAVREKLVDQEAEGLRQLNISRDQILKRLWELAILSPEVTRGSMAGQIKALSMIVAIEGFIPNRTNDRRLSTSQTQPAAPPPFYPSAWRSRQQQQAEAQEPIDSATAVEAQPDAPPVPEPPPMPPNHSSPTSPFTHSEESSQVPDAPGYSLDTVVNTTSSLKLPLFLKNRPFSRGR